MIYFDNSATTAVNPMVLRTYTDVATKIMGNPSSLHGLGTTATRLLEASRRQIAELLGVDSREIFFTSGGTEGDNWILKGVAFEKRPYGNHIIVSNVEHPAVKNTAEWLKTQGFEVDFAPVDGDGFVIVSELEKLIRDETILVSIMAVNNEVGTIQPIDEISDLLADKPTISFHVDAVQLVGKKIFNPYDLGIDSFSASAHKFHGPKGVGFLYIKDNIEIGKISFGGSQERNKRSGTENLNSILASSLALKIAFENLSKEQEHLKSLMSYLADEVEKCDYLKINGEDRINSIVSIQVKGQNIQFLLPMLDMKGIYVSGGSACMSGSVLASPTLINMGLSEEQALSSIRVSFSIYNTVDEVKYFIECLKNICKGE